MALSPSLAPWSSPERSVACDAVLIAAGRVPNLEGLGLEKAGVAYTERGVTVDAYNRTSQPHIYAAGDVAGLHQFTHVADNHARTVVRNILLPWFRTKRERTVVPWCTYTSPEVARVGLNEDQARKERSLADSDAGRHGRKGGAQCCEITLGPNINVAPLHSQQR